MGILIPIAIIGWTLFFLLFSDSETVEVRGKHYEVSKDQAKEIKQAKKDGRL